MSCTVAVLVIQVGSIGGMKATFFAIFLFMFQTYHLCHAEAVEPLEQAECVFCLENFENDCPLLDIASCYSQNHSAEGSAQLCFDILVGIALIKVRGPPSPT